MSTQNPMGCVRSSSGSFFDVGGLTASQGPPCRLLPAMGFVLAAVAILLVAAPQAQADVTWSTSSGNWSVSSNWGGNLPGPSDEAYIINGGIAVITVSGAVCNDLYLGDANSANSGTVQMSGSGSLSPTNNEYLGNYGAGTFTQSGGTNNVGNNNLYLGSNSVSSSGNGSYALSGAGVLLAGQEYVGNYGTGTFSQSGGTNTIATSLYVASSGSYTLSGSGVLSVGYGGEIVGNSGFGTFTQSGGTNTASYLTLSGGTYNLNGGALVVPGIQGTGNFNLGGGTLVLNSPYFSTGQNMTLTGSGGSGNINTSGNMAMLSGTLSGSGGLNVFGGGTLTLAGSNTYSGGTSISGSSTLLLNNASAVQNSTVNISADSSLSFDTGSGAIATFYLGGLTGSGGFSL
ncbi:MAG: hypothetical protein ABSG53_07620, partial [Thermoguttaceae bacterium]